MSQGKKKVLIVGGGICGLSAAKYLVEAGCSVVVLDKGDFSDNCSYGNAGFVCPSHYIQLATPGVLKQGLKWMLNAQSPFYIQPRLDASLIKWGLAFIKSARKKNIEKHGAPLRDIGLLAKREYEKVWLHDFDFGYQNIGMLEIFKTEKARQECEEIVSFGQRLGLDVVLENKEGLAKLEPDVAIDAIGAIHYRCDAHLFPNLLMRNLMTYLKNKGVQLVGGSEVLSFYTKNNSICAVNTVTASYNTDAVVLAAGCWSPALGKQLALEIPVVPGRGYSVTLPKTAKYMDLWHPGILVEGRCAVTPMDGDKLRFGGTMEITGLNTPPRINRVAGILKAVQDFFPEIDISVEEVKDKIWYGYRPVSADGMPYIGMTRKYENLVVATGHSQLGISLGPATGLLVKELIMGQKTSMDITTFAVERFS